MTGNQKNDLVALHNGEVIGVEHTRLHREDPSIITGRQLRPQEIIHWQIVEQARDMTSL
jgi:hypothetical protein